MKKLLIITVCISLLCAFVYAQSVDELIASYHKNMGGLEKLKALKSMKLTGTMPTPMGDLAVTIYKKTPNLSRTEIDFQGNKIIQAYDGTTAWAINPMTGNTEPQKLEGDMAKAIIEQAEFEDPFIDYAKKGHVVTLEGKEDVNGSECYKIKLVLNKNNDKDSVINYYYLDSEYFMPVMVKTWTQGQEVDTYLSDYQDVKDGLMMAYKMDIKVKDQVVQSISLAKVDVDADMDDSIFKFPETTE